MLYKIINIIMGNCPSEPPKPIPPINDIPREINYSKHFVKL